MVWKGFFLSILYMYIYIYIYINVEIRFAVCTVQLEFKKYCKQERYVYVRMGHSTKILFVVIIISMNRRFTMCAIGYTLM